MARKTQWSVIGQGNNGAVLQGPPGTVFKYTRDPTEIACWLAAVSLANRNRLPPGLPDVYDIHLGNRAAVIVREDINPLGRRHGLDPGSIRSLQLAGRLATRARTEHHYPSMLRSRRWRSQGLYGPLRSIGRAIYALESVGAIPTDLRPANLGRRKRDDTLVLHDPGRTPVETTLALHGTGEIGDFPQECPEQRTLARKVREMLGRAPNYSGCKIVNRAGLRRVMRKHGWSDKDIDGTAGFHTEDQRILLAPDGAWSLLHELVHAAGVTDKDLAPWLTEGITEATAQEVAKANQMKHHPTYEREVEIVRNKLAPATDTTVIELGRMVARRPEAAGKSISHLLAKRSSLNAAQWYKTIGPGVLTPDPFLKLLRKAK